MRFFYGARTRGDLFYLEELAAIAERLKDFKFVPALSHAGRMTAGTEKRVSFTRSSCGTCARKS